ncbi:MAG: HAMP domain-containing sensor histidine kinase [Bacteroidetes bacterium]|nr:HAMP domain-containing sensor histidine kinase [Bacteroidota bacterium]
MKSNKLIYFLAIFIVIAFSWWFYSLFELSQSNYISDKALLDKKYEEIRKDFYHQAFKNAFKGEQGKPFMRWGTELNIDERMVKSYFFRNYPQEPIYLSNTTDLDSVLHFVNLADNFSELKSRFKRVERMWIAEGTVFLIVLLMGIWFVIKSNQKVIATERQQRNFLLSITHEFKTPIASIKLYLQTIQKRVLSKEQVEMMIGNSLKDIERLNELSENVLVATKIESSGYRYVFDRFNLSELVEDEVAKFRHVKEGLYHIVDDIEPGIFLLGDKFTLLLVVSNLIENACKYSEPNTTIKISLKKAETTILQVADQGIGISDKDKGLVFKKFFRVGNENTRKTKGTGLGLYIVKEVSKKHHARVRIVNNKPKGSIFEIEFF